MANSTYVSRRQKALRLRKARNVIRGLVGVGYKIKPSKASPFTAEQMELQRRKRFGIKW